MVSLQRFVVLMPFVIMLPQCRWIGSSNNHRISSSTSSISSSSSCYCFASTEVESQKYHLRQSSSLLLPMYLPGRAKDELNVVFTTTATTFRLHSDSDNEFLHHHYHRTLAKPDHSKLYWIGIYTFLFCCMVTLISILIVYGLLPLFRTKQKYDDNDDGHYHNYNSFCCGRSSIALMFRSSNRTMITEAPHDNRSVVQPVYDQNKTVERFPNHTTMVINNDKMIDVYIGQESTMNHHNMNNAIDDAISVVMDQRYIPEDNMGHIANDKTCNHYNHHHHPETIENDTKQNEDKYKYHHDGVTEEDVETKNNTTFINTNTTPIIQPTLNSIQYCYEYDQDHTILVDVYHHYEYNDRDNCEIY
jgi:hypothetical protein